MRLFAALLLLSLIAAGCTGPQNEAMDAGQAVKLAGTVSNYYEYSPDAYRQALDSGKIVYLEFYAKWCPICRENEPEIFAAFDSLEDPDIVGFRVDFDREEQLKRQFQIPYQHTRLILKNGSVVARGTDKWDRTRIIEELEKAAKNG